MRDTIDMAREAGFTVGPSRDGPDDVRGVGENLVRFEVIVRADALANIDPTGFMSYQEADAAGRFAERAACEALYEHEDVQAPVGNSAWGEAYQDGWIAGAQAYRDAIRARGNT